MTPERWPQIARVYLDARDVDEPRRAAVLDETCAHIYTDIAVPALARDPRFGARLERLNLGRPRGRLSPVRPADGVRLGNVGWAGTLCCANPMGLDNIVVNREPE